MKGQTKGRYTDSRTDLWTISYFEILQSSDNKVDLMKKLNEPIFFGLYMMPSKASYENPAIVQVLLRIAESLSKSPSLFPMSATDSTMRFSLLKVEEHFQNALPYLFRDIPNNTEREMQR
eukprot:scaffold5856_cov109-Cylindrotheca_fusiformis.AAC.2